METMTKTQEVQPIWLPQFIISRNRVILGDSISCAEKAQRLTLNNLIKHIFTADVYNKLIRVAKEKKVFLPIFFYEAANHENKYIRSNGKFIPVYWNEAQDVYVLGTEISMAKSDFIARSRKTYKTNPRTNKKTEI